MEDEIKAENGRKCSKCLSIENICIFEDAIAEANLELKERGVDEGTRAIVSEVLLDYVVKRRTEAKKRQLEGINNARENGVTFGRKKKEIPKNFEKVKDMYNRKQISSREAAKMLGVVHSTFLKWIRESENKD